MTGEKRAYTPKVKGCYECSQRRIHCDRGEPHCTKCISRGLRCSGLGIRYRFSDDQSLNPQAVKLRTAHSQASRSSQSQPTLRHGLSRRRIYPGIRNTSHSVETPLLQPDLNTVGIQSPTADDAFDHDHPARSSRAIQRYTILWDLLTSDQGNRGLHSVFPTDILEPWKRHLLSYYAKNIAVELVVIDDQYNGWRHLVLSVASLDNLVLDAVLSAAAYHFWANTAGHTYQPELIYARAIRRLQERQDLVAQDATGKQAVILALLVLLSTVMINGGTDFPIIFNLLEAALEALGGEESLMQGELGVFVVRQVRKYRGYAAPLLSQAQGLARLSLSSSFSQPPTTATSAAAATASLEPSVIVSTATNGWDCFKSSYQSHPEHSEPLSMIYDLNRQACDIYVHRVLASRRRNSRHYGTLREQLEAEEGNEGIEEDDEDAREEEEEENLTKMVSKFHQTLQQLPDNSPGEHTLVFATFIAAAESVLSEHRDFFAAALLKHHRRNGFANLLLALDRLRKDIWSVSSTSASILTSTDSSGIETENENEIKVDGRRRRRQQKGHTRKDWTQLLPEFRLFIV